MYTRWWDTKTRSFTVCWVKKTRQTFHKVVLQQGMLIPGKSYSRVSISQSRVSLETRFVPSTCLSWCVFEVATLHKPITWTMLLHHPLTYNKQPLAIFDTCHWLTQTVIWYGGENGRLMTHGRHQEHGCESLPSSSQNVQSARTLITASCSSLVRQSYSPRPTSVMHYLTTIGP